MSKVLASFFIVVFFLFSCSSSAQLNNGAAPKQLNEQFFRLLEESGSNEALEYLFSTNDFLKKSNTMNLKAQLESLVSQIGVFRGYSQISSKTVGNDYILYTFLVKYDMQPIRLTITYYRPESKWQLQAFEFDDKMQEELKEAAAIYRLDENLPKIK